jgi:protein-S-isoprenylcysteine O-methyltransferase Ste14
MNLPIKLIVFAVATAGLAWVSRSSLRNFRSHGFFRFFAWEAILALILFNINYWFVKPFSIHQVVSWSLLLLCSYLVIHGALLLRTAGKPDRRRNDSSLIGIEKTTELVTVGAYRYIRHPVYCSLLCLGWGVFFKHPSWFGISLVAITTIFLTMTAKMEDAENLRFFGEAYQSYMERTKMFIPFLI